jgi:hypothetical protein
MENLSESQIAIRGQQSVSPLRQIASACQNNWWKIGFLVTVALFLATAGVLGFYVFKAREGKMAPQPTQAPTSIPTLVPTPTPDPTANWETYRNQEYGFEVRYPLEFQFVSEGPNSAQQVLNKGEQISGTMQPSYDTIVFSDDTNEVVRIEIFNKYEGDFQEENYKEGYLYLFGPCDLRWGFEAKFLNFNFVNNIKMLTVKGKNGEGNSQNCYYLENLAGNLIVISNKEYKSEIFNLMLSTFKFLEEKRE